MNFAGPNRRGGLPQKWFLTDEIREYIIRHYDSCNARPIAERFGIPRWKISRWAAELGVARTKEKPWSRQEVFYLSENLHRRSWKALARHLGRTETACRLKAKRLGIGKMSYAEGLTQRELARRLGVDDHAVARIAERGFIRRQRRGTNRTKAQGGDAWLYTDDAILRFVIEHPEEIDLRRVDRDWFFGLITPPILGALIGQGKAA